MSKSAIKYYEVTIAKVEVKVKNMKYYLTRRIYQIKTKSLQKNKSISMLPCINDKSEYDNILEKLQYIKVLKRQLKI